MSYNDSRYTKAGGNEIHRARSMPSWLRTPELYMHTSKYRPLDDEELRRGMCPKSGGDLGVCEHCKGSMCKVALLLMERKEEKHG